MQLAKADDELRRLGDLELGHISTQLATGEGAIIFSPTRATMIPASLIFPKSGIVQETTAIDQRFRGEQIISSAMRSLNSCTLRKGLFWEEGKTMLTCGLLKDY
ncbi:MAG TPA: hypothetical protein EYQ57_06375 [Methylococcaceae bacterium]|nr:hypothetical protein [Methylococcaceae bacterium]